MRSRFLFWSLPFFACATCSSAPGPSNMVSDRMSMSEPSDAQSSGGPVAVPVQLSPTFPRDAVDHVATYASWRGWGPRDGDRATIVRHGGLVRLETRLLATRRPDEAEVETSFANMTTGASLSMARDAEGVLAGVTWWQGQREADRSAIYRSRLVRTGRSEQIAGERCTTWRSEPETEGPIYTACIASDGVLLRDTVLSRSGSVMSERLALSVERRPVAPAEVLPPREALDWTHWAGRAPERSRENYVLTLAGRSPGGEALRRTFVADGIAQSEDQRTGTVLSSLAITNPAAVLRYSGTQPQLSISRSNEPTGQGAAAWFASAPLSDRGPERLLGETCHWFDAAVGVSDYGRVECRTADGLPMIIEERSRGHLRGRWEAVSLTRGRTPAGSVRPPADLLSWSRWGWPMLDGS